MGKELLAILRGGDFAHPGEAETLDLLFAGIPPDAHRTLLDVGCGRGGSAAYLHKHGYGEVSGFDIDRESIDYARKAYPALTLLACDVRSCSQCFHSTFSLIYALSVLYALDTPGQRAALMETHKLATPGAILLVFDYMLGRHRQGKVPAYRAHWTPLDTKAFAQTAAHAGWALSEYRDMTSDFVRWYTDLVDRIRTSRDRITEAASDEWWRFTLTSYENQLEEA